jgi:hypothetical protein
MLPSMVVGRRVRRGKLIVMLLLRRGRRIRPGLVVAVLFIMARTITIGLLARGGTLWAFNDLTVIVVVFFFFFFIIVFR